MIISASNFHKDCKTDFNESYESTFETPIPSAPVIVFRITGNFPPTFSKATSIESSEFTSDVLGDSMLFRSNARAVINLFWQNYSFVIKFRLMSLIQMRIG